MNRTLQRAILTLYIFLCMGVGIFGFYALHSTPLFYSGSEVITDKTDYQIKKIGTVSLMPTDIWKIPVFTSPMDEKKWWVTQQKLDQAIEGKKSVTLEIIRHGSNTELMETSIRELPVKEVFKKLSEIYVVALIYILTAISVFRRHPTTAGFLCTFFLVSTALYLISIAPVVHRPLFMSYEQLRLLISIFFISSTGQLAIVHFSIIFPSRTHFLKNYSWFPAVFYGYSVLISALYLFGIIALVTTLPFLIMWILVMLASFAHSMVREPDPFMKRQARNGFLAAALVVIFLVVSVVIPLNIEGTLINNFALFSLMLPFALIASLDNHYLYHQRLNFEKESHNEKARIHRELHDTALNDLASISIIAEGAQRFISKEPNRVQSRLEQIKDIATETSNQLRNFLWVIDDRKSSWSDVIEMLRKTGYDLLNPLNIGFDLYVEHALLETIQPTPAIKHALHKIFREAVMNVIKHANAKMVAASITIKGKTVAITIEDDGCGFENNTIREAGYGLVNIKKRIDEIGGHLDIETQMGEGTRLLVELPIS